MILRQRRLRGTPVRALNTKLLPEAKLKLDAIADALQLSEGMVLDLILEGISVDAAGRPDFWDGPMPEPRDPDQGALMAS